jgi:hypothetical protein
MESFNFAEACRYLLERHRLKLSSDELEKLMKDPDAESLRPIPNADGKTFSAAALDVFADSLKRAKLTQERLANAEQTCAS